MPAAPRRLSTQSRIICCSERMLFTGGNALGRLAIAAVTRWFDPPLSCKARSRSEQPHFLGRLIGPAASRRRQFGRYVRDRRPSSPARCRIASGPVRPADRKPSTSEPAGRTEDEKAVPMPSSSAASPDFSDCSTSDASPEPRSSVAMVSPIEPMVCSNPQNVPSRPRKISRPIQVARRYRGFRRAGLRSDRGWSAWRWSTGPCPASGRAGRASAPAGPDCGSRCPARKELTQRTSRKRRSTAEGKQDADDEDSGMRPLRPGLAIKAVEICRYRIAQTKPAITGRSPSKAGRPAAMTAGADRSPVLAMPARRAKP